MGEGFIVWITGLPASGKSTLARILSDQLNTCYSTRTQILESDFLRNVITPIPDYSMKERDLFYRVMGHLGILLSQNGVNVILDATGNRRQYRDDVRRAVTRFFEVYVRCPLEVCEARDPKGIYKRGRKGVTSTVPGVGDPYEEPLFPDVIVDSNLEDPDIGVVKILEEMKKVNWL